MTWSRRSMSASLVLAVAALAIVALAAWPGSLSEGLRHDQRDVASEAHAPGHGHDPAVTSAKPGRPTALGRVLGVAALGAIFLLASAVRPLRRALVRCSRPAWGRPASPDGSRAPPVLLST